MLEKIINGSKKTIVAVAISALGFLYSSDARSEAAARATKIPASSPVACCDLLECASIGYDGCTEWDDNDEYGEFKSCDCYKNVVTETSSMYIDHTNIDRGGSEPEYRRHTLKVYGRACPPHERGKSTTRAEYNAHIDELGHAKITAPAYKGKARGNNSRYSSPREKSYIGIAKAHRETGKIFVSRADKPYGRASISRGYSGNSRADRGYSRGSAERSHDRGSSRGGVDRSHDRTGHDRGGVDKGHDRGGHSGGSGGGRGGGSGGGGRGDRGGGGGHGKK